MLRLNAKGLLISPPEISQQGLYENLRGEARTSGNYPEQTCSRGERRLLSKRVLIWLIITFNEGKQQSNLERLRCHIRRFNELIPHKR